MSFCQAERLESRPSRSIVGPIIGREHKYGGIVEEKRRSVGKVIVDLEKGIKRVTKLVRDLGLYASSKPVVRITCATCGNILMLDAKKVGVIAS